MNIIIPVSIAPTRYRLRITRRCVVTGAVLTEIGYLPSLIAHHGVAPVLAAGVLGSIGTLVVATNRRACRSVRAQHTARQHWGATGEPVPGWGPLWAWSDPGTTSTDTADRDATDAIEATEEVAP